MSDYLTHLDRILRGAILTMLMQAPGERSSDVVLQRVMAGPPHNASLGRVSAQMRWLGERGYAEVQDVAGMLFAIITQRGVDLIEGRESDPEVERVRPR